MSKKTVLQSLFETGVQAAHPAQCLARHLPALPENGRLIVLGAGKGCAAMVQAMERHYEASGEGEALTGAAVTRHGYGLDTRYLPVKEAGHPTPNVNSELAASEALRIASGAGADDLVLVLLSGGASALWSAPQDGISLADKQMATKSLLRSGAAIDEINCVRKHLSRIKGGRLAAAAAPARLLTLAISDVPHDDISSIGSGPTVGDPTSCADALEIIERYQIDVSDNVKARLKNRELESLFPDDAVFENAEYKLVATPAMSLDAIRKVVEPQGYKVRMMGDSIEGEARNVGREHARLAREAYDKGEKTALISGGELTVTITGDGKGGPNQEYVLAMALGLDGCSGVHVFAGDSDGVDGGAGNADDPAGAFADPTTLQRAAALGVNAGAYLNRNDSGGFFERLGDLHMCGATQTNVNDIRIALIDP